MPAEVAALADSGADEILLRIEAAAVPTRLATLRALAAEAIVPLVARSDIADPVIFEALVDSGASRVVIESAALSDPDLIAKLAGRFGSERVGVEVGASAVGGGWRVVRGDAGTETEWDAVTWARVIEAQGGGEVVVRARGSSAPAVDVELVRAIATAVARPVMAVVMGGSPLDIVDALLIGDADAVVMDGLPGGDRGAIRRIKTAVAEHGLPVRL